MITRRGAVGLAAGGLAAAFVTPPGTAKDRPNILLIMLDDLGKEHVGCYGSRWQVTPHADALAARGIRYDRAWSMPFCVPSRATVQTGLYPCHHGWINSWNPPLQGVGYLDPIYYPSLARTLQDAGYATMAAGKWHLADFRDQPSILREFGFDEHLMWSGPESGVFGTSRYWDPYIYDNGVAQRYLGEFGEDLFAARVLNLAARSMPPWFAYYAMCLPHAPLIDATPAGPSRASDRQRYLAMIQYADEVLGRIVRGLDALGQLARTAIIWCSDNGAPSWLIPGQPPAKGTLGEHGIGVPLIVAGPGFAAGRRSSRLLDLTDILPTCAALAGVTPPPGDGVAIIAAPRPWIAAMGTPELMRVTTGQLAPTRRWAARALRSRTRRLTIGADGEGWIVHGEDGAELARGREPCRACAPKLVAAAEAFPRRDAAPTYRLLF